ncbi:hypothetical protein [Luteibacter sp. HA06]
MYTFLTALRKNGKMVVQATVAAVADAGTIPYLPVIVAARAAVIFFSGIPARVAKAISTSALAAMSSGNLSPLR